MFLLDTNVISELRKVRSGRADKNVAEWAIGQSEPSLFLSVVTIFELEVGMLLADRRDPKQGTALRSWLQEQVLTRFDGRILPVSLAVARRCAHLHVPYSRPPLDALIAATALVHGLMVVTRNVTDFEPTGVPVFNPWNSQ